MQKSHSGLKVKSKIWIEIEGEPVFGSGRRLLLEAIASHGSISQAARAVHVSYRKAWSHIQAMEERLGMRLVERRIGGKGGGGATLTREARRLLEKFDRLENGLAKIVDRKFTALFRRSL